MPSKSDLLAAYRRMTGGADPVTKREDHVEVSDLPTPREVEERRARCEACEHLVRAAGGLGCALCPKCPTGKSRRILFTLPKTPAGRAVFFCPAGKWDGLDAPASRERALRVVVVISSLDEGPTIRATVESYRSVPGLLVETIVVDDASTDNSCAGLPGHVIRRDSPTGVGVNFNDGAALATTLGADVLVFSDAHIRVSGALLRAVAEKCVSGPGVVCSSVRAYAGLPIGGFGGRLAKRELIWIQWAQVQPTTEWARVTAPFGGLYAMSAETARILAGPTGSIFDTVVGRYGYIEEMLGVKAHFLNLPTWVYAAAQHEHLFKLAGQGGGFGREQNLVYTLALYFSPEFFEERFRAAAEKLLPADEVAEIRALAEGKCATWTVETEREFYDALPEGQ